MEGFPPPLQEKAGGEQVGSNGGEVRIPDKRRRRLFTSSFLTCEKARVGN